MNNEANAAAAITRLHELIALAHDAVQDVYNTTPESDERFVPVDSALGDLEAKVRELAGGAYLPAHRVPELRRKLAA